LGLPKGKRLEQENKNSFGKAGVASIAHLSGILIAYFYIRGFYDGKRLWLKYKYWQSDRERQKFRVISNDDKPTYH